MREREDLRSRGGRGRATFVVRVLVSLGLLGLLLTLVDRAELVRRLGGADPAWVLGIVGLVTADRLLMAWKWWLLVRGREAAVSLWAAVRTYYLASFAGFFLPMTLGADAVRVAALAGEGRTAGLVASVVLERALGALAQGVLALVAVGALVALGLGATIGPRERWMAAGVLVAAFLAFPLSFPLAGRAAGRLQAVGGWRGTLRALAAAYAGYAEAAGLVLVFFGLTLLEGCIPVVYHYMAGRALGLDLGFSLFVATVPLVFLVARLPVSLGGIGVLETSFVYLAGLLGLGRTEALSIALLAEAVVVVSLSPGALVYLFPSTGHPRDGWAARPRERLP